MIDGMQNLALGKPALLILERLSAFGRKSLFTEMLGDLLD